MARSMPRGCVAVRVCGGVDSSQAVHACVWVDSSQAVREYLGVDSSSLSSLTGSAFFCHQLPEYTSSNHSMHIQSAQCTDEKQA